MKKSVLKDALYKLEIAAAVLLFLLMLINCGRYIDIKINGKTSNLPPIPEEDKKILLRISGGTGTGDFHTLCEPIFVCFRTSACSSAAELSEAPRKALRDIAYSYAVKLFSGTYETLAFENEEARSEYLDGLKNSGEFILLSFYGDIPASAILPIIAKEYENKSAEMLFNVQNLFIMPDGDGNAVGIAVSSGLEVNVIKSDADLPFNTKELEAYNNSAGFVPFEFEIGERVLPVYSNSISTSDYSVSNACDLYGRQSESKWVEKTLEVFGINLSLAKTFVTRDQSVFSYVDGSNEILFYSDGSVVYNSSEDGVHLSDFLGYNADAGSEYAFTDKITAVKNLVNMLDEQATGGKAAFGLSFVEVNPKDGSLKVGLKYFVNGAALTEEEYDALFVISGDYLTYASYHAVFCEPLESQSMSMPQKYAVLLTKGEAQTRFALLSPSESGEYRVEWASKIEKSS